MHITIRLIFICLTSTTLHAQPKSFTKSPALGIHLSVMDFKGADSLRAFGRNAVTGLSVNYQNSFSRKWDYSITMAGSFMEFADKDNKDLGNGKKQLLIEVDGSVRAHLLAPEKRVRPYLQSGIGVSAYNSYYGVFIPTGLGCQVNITPDVFVLVNSQYRIPVTNTQHQHFYHSIGIAGNINRKKIVKERPNLPLPPIVSVAKPIDSDGDGIVDSVDKCPLVLGVLRYHGCPVPDRDGDRINDEEDQCPDVKGVAQYKGCPIPDRDLDGVEDALDKCPDKAGNAANGGCPEIKAAIINSLQVAAQHIYFATGSYVLLKKSWPSLDEVANILKKDPDLKLIIEGHTDNAGTTQKNQVLSDNRAKAVMQYLTAAGITPARLQAIGYGQQQPVADNTTSDGRAKNRRVELKVFNQ
ncbi:OOP family OmpA-OmpF porin [Chitinophagaceae bacterium OAS944]